MTASQDISDRLTILRGDHKRVSVAMTEAEGVACPKWIAALKRELDQIKSAAKSIKGERVK